MKQSLSYRPLRCHGVKVIAYELGHIVYDPCPDEEAESYGIYEVEDDGCDFWIADFKTRELAEQYIRLRQHTCPCLVTN